MRKVASSYTSGWRYAEYAFQYGVSIVLCTLGGYWLDNWLETGNTFLIIGVLFGSVAGFINLYRAVTYKKKATGENGK
ncbi:MAG: AtpZ/AtpI family protein [Ignavibacteria bacterium]|nr:AtpZ/AtpI family protein [Ignavibacteria bacterium]